MVTLTIFGSGCAKCSQLAENAETAAKELGLDYELLKVTDRNAIVDAGIVRTPALMVGETLRVSGQVAGVDDIKKILA